MIRERGKETRYFRELIKTDPKARELLDSISPDCDMGQFLRGLVYGSETVAYVRTRRPLPKSNKAVMIERLRRSYVNQFMKMLRRI